MSTYIAPVRDMLFAMDELAQLDQILALPGCEDCSRDVATADGFTEAYRRFVDNGWNAMPSDPEFGGQGLPALVSTPVLEMWKASNMAFSLYPNDQAAASASAVPYLHLFGIVAGGWMMARQAEAARSRLGASATDDDFYRAKLATADFYTDQVLPHAGALKHAVVRGAESQRAGEVMLG